MNKEREAYKKVCHNEATREDYNKVDKALIKLERIEAIDLDDVQEALDELLNKAIENKKLWLFDYKLKETVQSLIDLIRSVK